MNRWDQAKLARKQLDAKFADGSLRALSSRPTRGWVRAVRDALGMNSRQLATRLGRTQSAVSQLEKSEVNGGVSIDSLRRAASALDCDLVYVLVPRTSLEETVLSRARALAKRDLVAVDRTMRLEDQGLDADELDQRIEDYAALLVADGRLWDDDNHHG
jgi:predicted DNA-binding mobile mystery protein A